MSENIVSKIKLSNNQILDIAVDSSNILNGIQVVKFTNKYYNSPLMQCDTPNLLSLLQDNEKICLLQSEIVTSSTPPYPGYEGPSSGELIKTYNMPYCIEHYESGDLPTLNIDNGRIQTYYIDNDVHYCANIKCTVWLYSTTTESNPDEQTFYDSLTFSISAWDLAILQKLNRIDEFFVADETLYRLPFPSTDFSNVEVTDISYNFENGSEFTIHIQGIVSLYSDGEDNTQRNWTLNYDYDQSGQLRWSFTLI